MIRRRFARLAFALAVLLASPRLAPCAEAIAPPPATRADSVREMLHGVEIVDPYRWLEDKSSPATRAWIGAQNAYTDGQLGARPGRDATRKRLEQLLKVDQVTVPFELTATDGVNAGSPLGVLTRIGVLHVAPPSPDVESATSS